ncbi:MAG: T9SS type A sorting domain-containing protein [candidate division KSB1 bacterium]|nr:T9SS type A sorting domain-containing protein [candidate division KSB1 bacterium]
MRQGAGDLLAGQTLPVPVVVNTAGLKPGRYRAKISVTSNDTSQSEIKVPVSLNVSARQQDASAHIQKSDSVWLMTSQQNIQGWVENVGFEPVSSVMAECAVLLNSVQTSADTVTVTNLAAGERRPVEFELPAPADSGVVLCVMQSHLVGDQNLTNNADTTVIALSDRVSDFDTIESHWSVTGSWKREYKSIDGSVEAVMTITSNAQSQTGPAVLRFKSPLNLQALNSLLLNIKASWWQSTEEPVCYIDVSSDTLHWITIDSLVGSTDGYSTYSTDLGRLQEKKIWFQLRYNHNTLDNLRGISLNRLTLTLQYQVKVSAPETVQPDHIVLYPNTPNPFNPVTTITFSLPADAQVTLDVFNLNGQRVANLLNQRCPSGLSRVQWNAEHFSSGLYFYSLQVQSAAGQWVKVGKMNLVR